MPPAFSELDLQIGVCIQIIIFDDITGFDGLHQSEIVRVNDCRSQTVHHSHSYHSRVHDRTDMFRHTVGVIGQTTVDFIPISEIILNELEKPASVVLHSFDNQEQRIEPHILSNIHTMLHTTLHQSLHVHHTLVIVFSDSFAVAKSDNDCVICCCKINILNSSGSICRV